MDSKWRLRAALGMLIGLFIAGGLGYVWAVPSWAPITDQDLQLSLLKENGRGLLQVRDLTKIQGGMEVMKISPRDSPPLNIYRFNTLHLCGIGGCLYSIYSADNRRLFQVLVGEDSKIEAVNNCVKIEDFGVKSTKSIKYCNSNGMYIQSAIEDKPN